MMRSPTSASSGGSPEGLITAAVMLVFGEAATTVVMFVFGGLLVQSGIRP